MIGLCVSVLLFAALAPAEPPLRASARIGQPAAADAIVGRWLGTLEVGDVKLRLVVKVTRGADGALAAKVDSPDQGAMDLAVDTIRLEGEALHFTMKAIGGSYSGTLDADGRRIKGMWRQGAGELPLELAKTEAEIAPPVRPQEPKPPLPYDEESVAYESVPGVTLSGTLTLPRGAGRVPAALLLSGSGPQDRDETIFGHRPFRVLADHLTRQGIAVLRVDDRGTAKSTGRFAGATSEDFAQDAAAGLAFLTRHARVDPARIGLVGHSEGGLVAPLVATRSPEVAFVVLLAGPGVDGAQILLEQSALLGRAGGMTDEMIRRNQDLQRTIFEIVRTEADADQRLTKIKASLASLPPSVVEAQAVQASSPWFRFFVTYDPAPVLEKVKQPVLAVNGAKDLQVSPSQNLPAIEQALKRGGNRDVTIVRLEGLNHLFQTAATGRVSEYATIEETFAPAALETISTWVKARMK